MVVTGQSAAFLSIAPSSTCLLVNGGFHFKAGLRREREREKEREREREREEREREREERERERESPATNNNT